jgi:hypothetical protein
MFALVKAENAEEAKKFATERGLSVVETLEITTNTVRIRVLEAIDSIPTHADDIIRVWFGEPGEVVPGYGWPKGSCIHFWY